MQRFVKKIFAALKTTLRKFCSSQSKFSRRNQSAAIKAVKGLRVYHGGSGRPGASGYLAAVLIVRDEARYLPEWIEFHRMVGVEHIYVYDNASRDSSWEILEDYRNTGFLSAIPWDAPHQMSYITDHIRAQRLAYWHALSNYGSKWRWMTFIDSDEFLMPAQGDNLPDLLELYSDLPGLALFWKMFGTSGHQDPPGGLVIENYTQRVPFPELALTKAIVNPRSVSVVDGVHLVGDNLYDEQRRPLYVADMNLNAKASPFLRKDEYSPSSEVFNLHHYYTRSQSEFAAKIQRAQEKRLNLLSA